MSLPLATGVIVTIAVRSVIAVRSDKRNVSINHNGDVVPNGFLRHE